MRLLILSFFGLITVCSFSQEKDTFLSGFETEVNTPFNSKVENNNFAIKGIVLPYALGNAGGMATYLGFEYGFFKRHSIGIDGMFNYTQGSKDMVTDKSGVTHDSGNRNNSREYAAFLNYRYYFNFQKLRKRGYVPYVSCYYRYGTVDRNNDPAYINDYISQNEKNNSVGIVVGSLTYRFLGEESKFVFDWNIGMFYKEKDIIDESNFAEKSNLGIRLGLYVNYFFTRKNKLLK